MTPPTTTDEDVDLAPYAGLSRREWVTTRIRDGATLRDVADALGVTGERVRQLVIDEIGEDAYRAMRAKRRMDATATRLRCPDCGRPKTKVSHKRCERCALDARAARCRWTPERIIQRAHDWLDMYGVAPSAMSWNVSALRRQGADERVRIFEAGDWPHTSTVQNHFGSWLAMLDAAGIQSAPTGAKGHGLQPGTVKR